ncbi:MAG: phenylpropionate dioxygenase-like ring-hydroxylating dioxygenase large terminal subunit [Oceanicoccus sp.]|jgi:phenylpropionate dioxygenase-like ring-hydroxylating dioxygenase large terminal subunit
MFINFWYAAEKSDDLTDTPIKVRMLDQDFVLFRDSQGVARCLRNMCNHRGASLAGGLIVEGSIQCPYHGWRFSGTGECVKIPQLDNSEKIPTRANIDSYPTEERYGIVFAFLGDLPEAERPPIMPVPEFDDDGWRCNLLNYQWQTNTERAVENGLDPGHNEYVHPTHGFEGNDENYIAPKCEAQSHQWGYSFMSIFQSPELKTGVLKELRDYSGDLEAGAGHHGPTAMWTHIHMTPTNWMHQYVFETPVDEENTNIFLVNMRNCMLDPKDDAAIAGRMAIIAEQDRIVMEEMEPTQTPATNRNEMFMSTDLVIAKYRTKLKEWEALGWRIDTDAVNAMKGKHAYAVPSPQRRKRKNWVIDSVPLISAIS